MRRASSCGLLYLPASFVFNLSLVHTPKEVVPYAMKVLPNAMEVLLPNVIKVVPNAI